MSPQFSVILCYVPTLPFIAIAIPRFYYVLRDLTASQKMTSPSIHRKKEKIKPPRWEFHVLYGNPMDMKNHIYWFSLSFPLFRKWHVCAFTQKQSFHLCPGSSWLLYLASSFISSSLSLSHLSHFIFCNFYTFISTDYFLFCILQTYSNFSCLKQ